MRRHARLNKLEQLATLVAPPKGAPSRDPFRDVTDEGWLAHFDAWGRDGFFDKEPDFPVALAWYRAALQTTVDTPAPDFESELADRPEERLRRWRHYGRAKQVARAWFWLADMYVRRLHGEPPVTETEFVQLAAWFEANATQLHQLSMPTQRLDLGNDKRTDTANLRHRIWHGPRAYGAGQLAEDLRQIKARYGERCAALKAGVATGASA
jgi:hypothetical protein